MLKVVRRTEDGRRTRITRLLLLPRWGLLALAMGVLLSGTPAEARRRARVRRPVIRRISVPTPAPQAADPVRNVIFFVADGYREKDWRDARAAQPGSLLAFDQMPASGHALPPPDVSDYDAGQLAGILGTGQDMPATTIGVPPGTPLLALARQYGKSVALVAGGSVTDPLPGGLAVPVEREDDETIARGLAAARVDVLFGRSGGGLAQPLAAAGYRVATDAQGLLLEEATPAAAIVSGANVPFDTLTFRALHLAARAPRGFLMAVGASPSSVSATELNAALTTAMNFARRDGRTLLLVANRTGDAGLNLYAIGAGASKFSGTIAATDVPKIVAGLAGLKVFRRDFSPLFASRSAAAPAPPKQGTTRMQGLPW